MDKRPIGVFDSGLGGLTAFRKLAELLPFENIIYLGDTGRVPYGSRSKETIIKYAVQDAAFLTGFDIKAIMVACNTVSATAMPELTQSCTVPVYGVVEEPVKTALRLTKNKIIGVIGTEATIRSGSYESALKSECPEVEVFGAACPLFVPLVENGRTDPRDIVPVTVAGEYLEPLKGKNVDTLIMGCTHYPLLAEIIKAEMGPEVSLVDSGAEAAIRVAQDLRERGLLSDSAGKGEYRFFVTDSTEGFSRLAGAFLKSEIKGLVKQVSLE